MPRLLLSKSQLLKERHRLQAFARFLPSLQMKRQQLMAAVADSRKRLASGEASLRASEERIASDIPMLSNDSIDLSGLVRELSVDWENVNIAGVSVKRIASVNLEQHLPSLLTRPLWVHALQDVLAQAFIQLRHNQAEQQVVSTLNQELIKVTQRINLFEKVLIPEAEANIRKIQIFLDDKAREAVVVSKIAKNKNSGATP